MTRSPYAAVAAVALIAGFGLVGYRAAPLMKREPLALNLPFGRLLPPDLSPPDSRLAADLASPGFGVDRTPVGAIEPADAPVPVAPPPPPPRSRLGLFDQMRFNAAAALYRKGNLALADTLGAPIADPIQRAALDWVALKSAPSPERLEAFAAAHADWPALDYINDIREGWLYAKRPPAKVVEAAFAAARPRSLPGWLAPARAAVDEGRGGEAADVVRKIWRERDFNAWTETAVLKDFGGLLTRADHKYRADRLLYAENYGPAMRAAALAGADEVALANARIEAARGPLSPRAIAAVPASLQGDPGLLFARVQDARRGGRTAEADAWLALAPKDPAALVDPDKWWSERRMVAREWLDRGAPARGYWICANAVTSSAPSAVDAAFHAGWIALRFLDDPQTAARHFEAAAAAAITPLARARAGYWQGRAAEAMNKADDARRFYEGAAAYPIAYYGQLAARKLGRDDITPRTPAAVATGDERADATRVIELYYDAGLDDFAAPLAYSAASNWTDAAQIGALGEVIARRGSATTNVLFGKLAMERGFAVDDVAFPTFGLPSFAPLPHSADVASVLAVTRQESEFISRASSGAGAKGLMQIMPATAQMTARRAGVPFDFARLTGDPAFNLQLGAAYLGQLREDEGGSLEMTLAAYNAGAGRVAQWIAAYGDPRSGAVDPVDWVERIPFDETRDYVQRVSENLGVYRARLGGAPDVAQVGRLARE
jgi:soluble lytic murein transglycosylase